MPQFADDSMTPAPISVTRDSMMNEIPTDKPMHENTTPGEGAWNNGAGHYANEFTRYGVEVEDRGKTPVSSSTTVNAGSNARGKES